VVVVDVWKADALEPVCYSKREVEKRASVKVAHKKCLLLPFLRRRRQKDKGRREKFLLEIAAYSATRETSEDENRARLDAKTSNLRVHFVASFFFLSLARLLLFTSIARFSIERKKTSRFTTTRGVQITRNTTLKRASRDVKKNALALKRHANEIVPFENLLDNKDDGAKDAVVHIVADILIYLYML